jgi:hypothetical protein
MESKMSDQSRNIKGSGKSSLKDYVTVAFAEDLELARQHKQMLEENGIPSVVKPPEGDSGSSPGIAVLVSEEDLDQAHDLIASQASFEEFFDVFFQGNGQWLEDEVGEDEYD